MRARSRAVAINTVLVHRFSKMDYGPAGSELRLSLQVNLGKEWRAGVGMLNGVWRAYGSAG